MKLKTIESLQKIQEKKINKRISTIFEKIKNEKFRLKDAIEEKNSQKG